MALGTVPAVSLGFAFEGLVGLIQNLERGAREDLDDIVEGTTEVGFHPRAQLLNRDELVDYVLIHCLLVDLLHARTIRKHDAGIGRLDASAAQVSRFMRLSFHHINVKWQRRYGVTHATGVRHNLYIGVYVCGVLL